VLSAFLGVVLFGPLQRAVAGTGVGPDATSVPTSSTVAPTTLPAALPPTSLPPTSLPPTSLPPTSPPTFPATVAPTTSVALTTLPVPSVVGPVGPVAPITPPALTRSLKVGMRGDDVEALESKLDALKYDTGPVDGKFDWQTWEGVLAFEKVEGLKRTGVVTSELWTKISLSKEPTGVVVNGGLPRIEVDISRQVMFVYHRDGLFRTVAISSGSGKKYCEISKKTKQKACGDARTPRGNFKIQRRIPGWRESDLGRLYNPLYFNGGFAIHGGPSVPAYPASHGCVRIPMYTAKWLPDEVKDGTPVFVYD
jgi:peptidoglycan hydrolase-like protein with peptidoglycan-binding domain